MVQELLAIFSDKKFVSCVNETRSVLYGITYIGR